LPRHEGANSRVTPPGNEPNRITSQIGTNENTWKCLSSRVHPEANVELHTQTSEVQGE